MLLGSVDDSYDVKPIIARLVVMISDRNCTGPRRVKPAAQNRMQEERTGNATCVTLNGLLICYIGYCDGGACLETILDVDVTVRDPS